MLRDRTFNHSHPAQQNTTAKNQDDEHVPETEHEEEGRQKIDWTQKAREFINNKTQEGFERNQINKSFTISVILCISNLLRSHTYSTKRCIALNGTNNCDPRRIWHNLIFYIVSSASLSSSSPAFCSCFYACTSTRVIKFNSSSTPIYCDCLSVRWLRDEEKGERKDGRKGVEEPHLHSSFGVELKKVVVGMQASEMLNEIIITIIVSSSFSSRRRPVKVRKLFVNVPLHLPQGKIGTTSCFYKLWQPSLSMWQPQSTISWNVKSACIHWKAETRLQFPFWCVVMMQSGLHSFLVSRLLTLQFSIEACLVTRNTCWENLIAFESSFFTVGRNYKTSFIKFLSLWKSFGCNSPKGNLHHADKALLCCNLDLFDFSPQSGGIYWRVQS